MRKEVPPVHPEEEGDRSKEEDLEKSEPIQKTRKILFNSTLTCVQCNSFWNFF
jgi:hypothetical protein